MNDRTLQELLGHKTPRMILRYSYLGPTHLWNALEGLTKQKREVPEMSTATKTDSLTNAGKTEKR